MNMISERKNYPKVDLRGDAGILLDGVVRNSSVMNLTPSGIQVECRHQLVEQLCKHKSSAGLFPSFELEFELPVSNKKKKTIKSVCNVSYCRRQRQDSYHLGLNFVVLEKQDKKQLEQYLYQTEAAAA